MATIANVPPAYNPPPISCDEGKTPFGDCAKPKVLCASEIHERFQNTSVTLNIIPLFTQGGTSDPDPEVPVGVLGTSVPMTQSGFFIKRGFIVSSSAFLGNFAVGLANQAFISCTDDVIDDCTPTAVAPVAAGALPSPSAVADLILTPPEPGAVQPTLADFYQIFVNVYHVNNCPQSYVYSAFLVGCDFQTGIAVFRINRNNPWNKCLPCIQTQSCLRFGEPITYPIGSPVHVLGQWNGVTPQSFSSGTLVNGAVTDEQGIVTYAGVATTAPVDVGAVGAPILNQCGYVIGVVSGISTSSGSAFGVSNIYAERIVEQIICAFDNPNCGDYRATKQPLLGFIVYNPSTINISYEVATGLYIASVLQNVTDSTDSRCQENRQIRGIVYSGDLQNGDVDPGFTYCDTDDDSDEPIISVGDIITSINGIELGSINPTQNGPELIFYQLGAGCQVQVKFLKLSEEFTQFHCRCIELTDANAWISVTPPPPAPNANIVLLLNWFARFSDSLSHSILINQAVRGAEIAILANQTTPLTLAAQGLYDQQIALNPLAYRQAVFYHYYGSATTSTPQAAWTLITNAWLFVNPI